MIKFAVKSYFLSLKWIFIPLLIIAICLVPACIIFLVQVQGELDSMTNSLSGELGQMSCDIEGLINFVINDLQSLDWKHPFNTIQWIVETDWVSTEIEAFLDLTKNSSYTSAMQGDIKQTANAIMSNLSVFPIAIIAGLLLAYLVTGSFLRKRYCPRSIWKTILNVIIDMVLTYTLVAFVVALIGVWVNSVFITSILTALFYGFISISEAYIIHKDKSMKYTDVVNVKNLASLLISYLLLLIFAVVIIILLFLIPIKLIGLVLSLPVIIITFINYNLAAESYVTSKRMDYDEKKLKAKKA